MVLVVRQTRDERIKMYNKCTKKQIISMLEQREKYSAYMHFNTPKELIKTIEEYKKLKKSQLCEIMADRAVYENPDGCTETINNNCDSLDNIYEFEPSDNNEDFDVDFD